MELADTWMQSESSFHENETGRTDAKKYVILMTDGVNNQVYYDTQTLTACESMKDEGVTIFTIGYALNLQLYSSDTGHVSSTTFEDITRARSMLSECASSAAHFKTTDNDTDIDEIFENIGAEIAAQFLRISH